MMNDAQRAAATHKDGPCLVVAGAGSGKTTVLTERVKNLLADGVPAKRILCCTFTKKAAEEMKTRIRRKTGQSVDVTTLHALAYRMLQDEWESKKLLTRTEWLVERALQETASSLDVSDMQAAISLYKSQMIPPDQVKEVPVRQVYQAYESIKESLHYLDFPDLLLRAIQRMKTEKPFRRTWQTQWEYVMVDEFQDTSPAQWALVKLLVQRHRNIFAVGDDYQSIYSFNGAEPSIMLNFTHTYPHVRQILMTTNYRCREPILKVAQAVIRQNKNQIWKDVVAHRKGGDPVIIVYVKDEEHEAYKVARLIQKARKKNTGLQYRDFAVLYRTNQQSRPFEEVFSEKDIPAQVFGDKHFYELPNVAALLSDLRVIEQMRHGREPDPGELTAFLKIWVKDYKQLKIAQEKGVSAIQENPFFYVVREKWRAWANIESPVLLIDRLYSERFPPKPGEPPDAPLWLDSLKKSAAKAENVADFLRRVEYVLQVSKDQKQDAVQLMTIHRAKGLEFHTVFVADLVDTVLPYKKSVEDGKLEEETRLCYVAFTRAKEELYLMVPGRIGSSERSPSPYLLSIQHLCEELGGIVHGNS